MQICFTFLFPELLSQVCDQLRKFNILELVDETCGTDIRRGALPNKVDLPVEAKLRINSKFSK